jgi:type IV pilus assembly protein PilC
VRTADQLEADESLSVRSSARWSTAGRDHDLRRIVLIALVCFLVPVFEKIFEEFGGELPPITAFTVWLSHLFTQRWSLMIALPSASWSLQEVEGAARRPPAVGRAAPQDRRSRSRHRPKVALARWSRTLLVALTSAGVAAAAGARHHGQYRRQHRRREGHGRRPSLNVKRAARSRRRSRLQPCSRTWSPT